MTEQVTEKKPSWGLYEPAEHVDVHGVDVAYRRKGEGEPVLYLHGLGLTRRWLPFHEALAQGSDVIAPEQPGFGETPRQDWIKDWSDVVLHTVEFADVLGLERFHLVGYSFGGWLAAEIAAFYPERLKSLTLITPFGLRVEGHTPADIYRMTYDPFMDRCLNDRRDEFSDYVDEGGEMETRLQSYAEISALGRVAWNPRYDYKLERRLARVTAPALVIGVDDDRILPREHVDRYAELLPNARKAIVSGTEHPTGHGVVAQEPQLLADEILTTVKGR
ncbi:MAG TPA: alpha/beta hydrolase [Baekduia sp.]|nr:alpha/beta hydrolase [Baekduia sp.]